MTVILKNTSGRLQTFVLAHETYCRALGECACEVTTGRAGRRTPRSLTLATGVASPELPEAVLALPEVRRALAEGAVSARRVTPPPPEVREPPSRRVNRPTAPHPKKKRGSR